MNRKYIAALEIGSSRIKGIVASAEPDGRLKVIGVEEAVSGDTVRHGRIQNAREASDLINNIIRRLENLPQVTPGRISTVFIADGGRSLLSESKEGSVSFGTEEEITHRTLERLQKEAMFSLGSGRDVLAIAPKKLFVDQTEVKKIVGTFGSTVRGEFTLITQAPENHRGLERLVIESKGEDVKRDYVTRLLAQTEMALTDSDRQVGCLFMDFGAETTSLAAFKDGALIFAATIPVGSANITRDLSSVLNITHEKAENLKRTKGEAVVDRTKYDAPDEETREIVGLVSARAGEIVANVNNIMHEAGLKPTDFAGGAVIAGGGARLKGFPEMVEQLAKMKVRVASVDNSSISAPGIRLAEHFDVVSLAKYAAAHSDMECIVFPEKKESPVEEPEQPSPERERVVRHEPVQPGRRVIAEDDPGLLEDDKEPYVTQPVNINSDETDDLPEQNGNPAEMRSKLMEKIRNLGQKARNFMKTPIEGVEGGDLDD